MVNPYHPPTVTPPKSPPTFRWRVIPTFFGILYAGASFFSGALELAIASWGLIAASSLGHWRDLPIGWLFLDATLSITAGVLFVMASRAWWNETYKRAVLFTAVSLLPFVTSSVIKSQVIFGR